jgi:hypothetical protein
MALEKGKTAALSQDELRDTFRKRMKVRALFARRMREQQRAGGPVPATKMFELFTSLARDWAMAHHGARQ